MYPQYPYPMQGAQLTPQGWLSSALGGASPLLTMIPGVGALLGPAAGIASAVGQGTGLFNAGPQQQQQQQQQLMPQGWLSNALSTASPFLSMIPGVGGVLGPAAGAAGGFGQGTGLFNAGPQQQQQQLMPQGWLSNALSTASPLLSMIPGVGGVLGPAAGAAGGFGQGTGLFNAGPQFNPQSWLSSNPFNISPTIPTSYWSTMPGSAAGVGGGSNLMH